MTLSKKPYKGTRDFFPQQQRIKNHLFEKMTYAAELYGYEPYDGPLLEEVELYKAKSGEELINEQIYSFYDRGERHLAIRPEMTPTLARMVANIHREVSKPIRWFSLPNLMRYERPQKGRLREHWQFNCDVFGGDEVDSTVEVLSLIVTLLQGFGASAKHFEILINSRKIVDALFGQVMQADQETQYRLYKIIDKSKKIKKEDLEDLLDQVNLSSEQRKVFDQYLQCQTLQDISDLLGKHKLNEELEQLNTFIEQATKIELVDYLKYDPSIVRGLDYYTGLVFEVFDKNPQNRRAICGGGAHATLLQIFNEPPLPGVGFGLGDVTLMDFLTTHQLIQYDGAPLNDLLLTFQTETGKEKALQLGHLLRQHGIKVVSSFEKIKINKAFSLAEKKGAQFVSLLGDRELDSNQVQIKSLQSKEQKAFSLQDVSGMAQFIQKG